MLFEIGDPSQLIVRGDIAEIDIGRVEIDQDVDIIVDAYPDTTYRGRVRWIAPVGQQKQGSTIVTFDTEIEITDNAPRLRQGMSCDIDILFARRDSAVYLPVERVLEVFDDEDQEDERGREYAWSLRRVYRPVAGFASCRSRQHALGQHAPRQRAATAAQRLL